MPQLCFPHQLCSTSRNRSVTVLQADACSGSSLWCTASLLILMQFLEIKQELLNSFSLSSGRIVANPIFSFQSTTSSSQRIWSRNIEPQAKDQGCISQGQIPLLSSLSGNGPLHSAVPCQIQHPPVGDVQSPKYSSAQISQDKVSEDKLASMPEAGKQ